MRNELRCRDLNERLLKVDDEHLWVVPIWSNLGPVRLVCQLITDDKKWCCLARALDKELPQLLPLSQSVSLQKQLLAITNVGRSNYSEVLLISIWTGKPRFHDGNSPEKGKTVDH